MRIPIGRDILSTNDNIAEELQTRFRKSGLLALNIMGSPGAGKTSLIEQTLIRKGDLHIGVIEGDLATSLDADRIAQYGTPVVQINTGGICHLDANMIRKALEDLDISGLDLLIIENVGNLVCPVQFDLGETVRVLITSLPEGDDKVFKYPEAFSLVPIVVLNKVDLAEQLQFDRPGFRRGLSEMNTEAKLVELSCSTGEGIDSWMSWLHQAIEGVRCSGGG